MTNIVYTTTLTKPAPRVALANALADLITFIPLKEVVDQTIVETGGPRPEDEGRALCFRLTDTGLDLFDHGTVGPPPAFQHWPDGVDEPTGWGTYPIETEAADRPSFWVFIPAFGPDQTPIDRDAAEARLASNVGARNIVGRAKHYMPAPPATGRSQWGYFWRLNTEGELLFMRGYTHLFDFYVQIDPPWDHHGNPIDRLAFSDRPVPIPRNRPVPFPWGAGGVDAGDWDEVKPTDLVGIDLPPSIHALLTRETPTLISELVGHRLRVIRPGDVVTMDYRPDRFNIVVTASGVIIRTGFY